MAKKDKRLYESLRRSGVRKRAARTAAKASRAGGERGRRALATVAQELHDAAGLLEERARVVEGERGEADRADPDGALRDAARKTAAERV